jgi:hypothetical protein
MQQDTSEGRLFGLQIYTRDPEKPNDDWTRARIETRRLGAPPSRWLKESLFDRREGLDGCVNVMAPVGSLQTYEGNSQILPLSEPEGV